METLFKKHDQYMANTPTEIIRDIMDEIHWDSRLIAIIGARGVGKSTLIRQFIKKNYPVYDRSVLYCSLDSVYFSTHTILDLVENFSMNGGKRLFFDEIHKYMNWSREIKEIKISDFFSSNKGFSFVCKKVLISLSVVGSSNAL